MFEVGLRLIVVYLSAKTLEWLERSSEFLKIGNLLFGTGSKNGQRISIFTELIFEVFHVPTLTRKSLTKSALNRQVESFPIPHP
jgi:hypothetical protein